MATKVKPISTLPNSGGRKRRRVVSHRTRWEVVPSARKILTEDCETESPVDINHNNLLGTTCESSVGELFEEFSDPCQTWTEYSITDSFQTEPVFAPGLSEPGNGQAVGCFGNSSFVPSCCCCFHHFQGFTRPQLYSSGIHQESALVPFYGTLHLIAPVAPTPQPSLPGVRDHEPG